ncbi:MAG TPA: class I SAM-dependent methyltransferase [Metalysinibacillus jejuensis]|uniref:Class I SAM-dependent methyltransferase n=1 Tax=Metalysinibacillus jejuensis TaxID=914327 RepID=A0A921T4G7_9BACL|nr:class I SAM-dependent methyltransferase [Metalysinibacillus jejuensis]HJH10578.1 class I SAM-dependent methyltransferase [Metalysinibacillus jejuensis]
METMERLFAAINDRAEHFTTQDMSYLEGVLAALDEALEGKQALPIAQATKDDIRKAVQIAVLKGMRKSAQPNHQMTPDTLGFLVGYLVEQFFPQSEKITVLDLALGTGNLLFTIMNMVDRVEATGIEIDELLIHLASATAELLEHPVTLYRQDALEKLLVAPVDAVVCDLPVGYYPNEEVALDYELCAPEGMSYAHHLFIEQAMNYVKEGGYAFFLIPATLFESEQAAQLHKYIKSHAWIQAVIQLPDGMFTSRAHEKSLLILQKQHAEMRAPKEVLLAKVPSLQNKNALSLFFEKVKIWQEQK